MRRGDPQTGKKVERTCVEGRSLARLVNINVVDRYELTTPVVSRSRGQPQTRVRR